ncbi:hypothetical protein NAEGRDRAFT_82132 [Naegleria gruberi]|uniref:Uncharacterized protein n=1 Tax=Naegleria gruberi TaxID=5762 RepID=D2W2F3_NAEGR|nr:uncharacterized protein NAEGRDRAFT_82132 [Naegleria gruberi]EFC36737.1 hypothetical protein NAEGRDRAFT_82132 [Naegleria gruberi]|eukprot:XP_002669481.1 hypothetical protein NAEGRDRAFT_82132 [Naegleria gruberi strain NEG-M]
MPGCYTKFSVVEFATPSKQHNTCVGQYNNPLSSSLSSNPEMPRKRGRPAKNPNSSSVKMMITKTEMFNASSHSSYSQAKTQCYPYESEIRLSSGITKQKNKKATSNNSLLSCSYLPSVVSATLSSKVSSTTHIIPAVPVLLNNSNIVAPSHCNSPSLSCSSSSSLNSLFNAENISPSHHSKYSTPKYVNKRQSSHSPISSTSSNCVSNTTQDFIETLSIPTTSTLVMHSNTLSTNSPTTRRIIRTSISIKELLN